MCRSWSLVPEPAALSGLSFSFKRVFESASDGFPQTPCLYVHSFETRSLAPPNFVLPASAAFFSPSRSPTPPSPEAIDPPLAYLFAVVACCFRRTVTALSVSSSGTSPGLVVGPPPSETPDPEAPASCLRRKSNLTTVSRLASGDLRQVTAIGTNCVVLPCDNPFSLNLLLDCLSPPPRPGTFTKATFPGQQADPVTTTAFPIFLSLKCPPHTPHPLSLYSSAFREMYLSVRELSLFTVS